MGEETDSRLQKLVRVFGHTSRAVELDSGTKIGPTNARADAYEVQVPETGAVDVVDVSQFKSVRDLDRYLRQLENTAPEPDGVGVA